MLHIETVPMRASDDSMSVPRSMSLQYGTQGNIVAFRAFFPLESWVRCGA